MGQDETSRGSALPGFLIDRYRSWRVNRFEPNQAWYARLADDGQRPRTMVIACCDSRVDVANMFGAEPGDLFLVRNVANLAPPYRPDHMHHGTSAAIEYAVDFLHVAHIVVLGHGKCGGIAACREFCAGEADEALTQSTFLRSWTEILAPAYERAVAALDAAKDAPSEAAERRVALQRLLEHEGVRASLANLRTFPCVRKAVAAGRLTLHGAWLDISDGRLHAMAGPDAPFRPV